MGVDPKGVCCEGGFVVPNGDGFDWSISIPELDGMENGDGAAGAAPIGNDDILEAGAEGNDDPANGFSVLYFCASF
jgi:hypothetical protein